MAPDPTTLTVRAVYDHKRCRVRLRVVKARPVASLIGSAFHAFYEAQTIVPAAELPQLLACLQTPLPLDVRVSSRAPLSDRAFQRLRELLPPSDAQQRGGRQLAFAHDAWQFAPPARGGGHVALLHRQMCRGALERQELASMVPAVVLDVRACHRVLDMCAAPGSKSCQILEMMERDAEAVGASAASGFLIANDGSQDRAIALNHRMQVANIASPFLLVSCLDARWLDVRGERFDRILLDVPCSGDGILRKRHGHTPGWSATTAHALHVTQLQLLRQAIHLLAPGGLLVYSTCSFNPLENEAVVAQALRLHRRGAAGTESSAAAADRAEPLACSLELLDPRENAALLRDLHPHNGLCSWDTGGGAAVSMAPPSPEQAAVLGLERCVRLLPHRDDCSGFFLAMIRKSAGAAPPQSRVGSAVAAHEHEHGHGHGHEALQPLTAVDVPTNGTADDDAATEDAVGSEDAILPTTPSRAPRQAAVVGAPLAEMESLGEATWSELASFYGIMDVAAFQRGTPLLRACRTPGAECGAQREKLYALSTGAAAFLLDAWQPSARGSRRRRHALLHAGAKTFERLKLTNVANRELYPCEWRPCQQALPALLRWVTRRTLVTTSEAWFASVLRRRQASAEEILTAPLERDGVANCCAPSAPATLIPGGAVLVLEAAPLDGGTSPRAGDSGHAITSPAADEAGRAGTGAVPVAPPRILASVACVLAPGGGLSIWVAKEELCGILELLRA